MNVSFGTDGIRGPVDSTITPDLCLRIGQAAGQVLKAEGWDTVLIGKDTRVSGYMLESALEAGFIAAGVNVRLLGPLPTPGVAYLTKSSRGQFGLVISASHNTYLDNGIKIFDANGVKISKELQHKIEKAINTNSLQIVSADKLGKARRFDESGDRYVEFCKSTVPQNISFKGLRIVLDCANGAAYKVSPAIFEELGAEVIALGTTPNGYNINEGCGSTNPESAQKAVLEHRADFGVTLDGDADRVKLIDASGNILDGDDILYILASGNTNRIGPWSGIVGTVLSNLGLELAIKDLGYDFERSDVGDTYVNDILTKKGWYLGGEPSGHIICRDLVSTGDGTVAALKTISTLLLLEKDASEALKGFNKVPQVELSIEVTNKDVLNEASIQTRIQEIRSDLTIGRILVRPSGTEPKIRIMVEAESESTAKKCAQDLASLFKMINAVANWKLNGSARFCHDWFDEFNENFHGDHSDVAIAPPAIYIPLCNELKQNNLNICAQNLDYSNEAARTGEISLEMLKDMDCSMSIIGHSERRNIFGETSEIIRNKLEKIASHTFTSIYCIGESLAEYDSGKSLEAIKNQLDNELLSLNTNIKLYIAYEPIWAIGSGKLPSTQEIESMHGFIRDTLSLYDNINVLGILYGGSVSVENSQELSESELIDGVLVGGASLNGKSFAKIASSFDKV